MAEHVALYVLSGSSSSGSAVLENIRASDFIDEINSGEGPREECGLYSLIQLVQPADSVTLKDEKDVLDFHAKLVKGEAKASVDGAEATWNASCLLIADKDQDDQVLILELEDGKVGQRLKAKAKSSVEVVRIHSILDRHQSSVTEIAGAVADNTGSCVHSQQASNFSISNMSLDEVSIKQPQQLACSRRTH
jgi:hypothetical protein